MNLAKLSTTHRNEWAELGATAIALAARVLGLLSRIQQVKYDWRLLAAT